MKKLILFCSLVNGLALSLPATANALPQSPERIPWGEVFSCETCHPSGDPTQLNPFGKLTQGIRHALIQPDEWWTIMYNVDSDGDGKTNGEELGDPCGEWAIGKEMPVVVEVSNPGDPESVTDASSNADCPPLPVADNPPESDAAPSEASQADAACAVLGGAGTVDAPRLEAFAALGLLLCATARRRRRDWPRGQAVVKRIGSVFGPRSWRLKLP